MDSRHRVAQGLLDVDAGEAIIPWAEGNGLWRTINELASDLSGVDILTFFVQNPYTCDSADSLAVRVGRHTMEVGPVLEALAGAGFLKRMDLNGLRIYELTDEPYLRQTLQQYVTWLQEGYHWARMVVELRSQTVSAHNLGVKSVP